MNWRSSRDVPLPDRWNSIPMPASRGRPNASARPSRLAEPAGRGHDGGSPSRWRLPPGTAAQHGSHARLPRTTQAPLLLRGGTGLLSPAEEGCSLRRRCASTGLFCTHHQHPQPRPGPAQRTQLCRAAPRSRRGGSGQPCAGRRAAVASRTPLQAAETDPLSAPPGTVGTCCLRL